MPQELCSTVLPKHRQQLAPSSQPASHSLPWMSLEKDQGRRAPADNPGTCSHGTSRGASGHQQAARAASSGGAATLATAAGARPPSPPPYEMPHAALRLHQAIAVLGAMTQAAITVSQWHGAHSSAGRLQTVLILLASTSLAATTLLFPAFYYRYR